MKKIILTLLLMLALVPNSFARDYIIGEGDTLKVQVWGESELESQVIVRPDGKVSMPGIDDLKAAGLTLTQFKERAEKQIARLVKDSIVSVSLIRSVNSRVFIVGGGVNPTVYDMPQRTTLLQVLASVGSLDAADLEKAYLYRNGKKIMSDFSGLFSKGEFEKDMQLEPNDTIFLPVKYERNVFVLGSVKEPKAIVYYDGLTVLDALLQAGSFDKYADEDEITVIRKAGGGNSRIVVKTEELFKEGDFKQNIMLKAGDYIIASESFF